MKTPNIFFVAIAVFIFAVQSMVITLRHLKNSYLRMRTQNTYYPQSKLLIMSK